MQERGRGGGEGVRTRDHLANVRTTLAWLRMGLILMGIGYATDKLAVTTALHGAGTAPGGHGHLLGLLVVVDGVVVAAATLPRYVRARARIESARFSPHPWSDLGLVAAAAAGGLLVILELLSVAR